MPFNHVGNQQNGSRLLRLLGTNMVSRHAGRTTGLQIFEMTIQTLLLDKVCGEEFTTIVQSIEKDDARDRIKGYRQPTNHDDRDGNLPVAPPARAYREYFVPGNKFPFTGFPRLVADITNKRLYLTPTHYDRWFAAPAQAAQQDVNQAGGNMSPFFLLRQVRVVNDLFD